MAESNSARSVFKIDDSGATLRDLSDYVDEIHGLPGPRKLTAVAGLASAAPLSSLAWKTPLSPSKAQQATDP